jgi:hypothetical protein
MKDHNKITFVREYCLARRIPYKIKGEQLSIRDKETKSEWLTCFSIYNLTYSELLNVIDRMIIYDQYGYFQNVNVSDITKGW